MPKPSSTRRRAPASHTSTAISKYAAGKQRKSKTLKVTGRKEKDRELAASLDAVLVKEGFLTEKVVKKNKGGVMEVDEDSKEKKGEKKTDAVDTEALLAQLGAL